MWRKMVLFFLFFFWATTSWAEGPYWIKLLWERGGASVSLKGLSLAEDGTIVLGGRVISDVSFSFLARVSPETVDSLVFRPKINGTTFSPHPNFNDVLSLAGEDIFVSAYDYPVEAGSYAPFFVVKGEETNVLFLDNPCKDGVCLNIFGGNDDTFHQYLVPAKNGFYFVSSASVNADCGVRGIYVAYFDTDNASSSWQKFLAPAYERRTCTSYDENNLCTAYDIAFPVSCLLTSHIPYFAAATVDRKGNLIVVGDFDIAYADQIEVNSNAAFIWSISPTGETNWLKVFALSGRNSLNFQKVLSLGENKIAVLGDVTLDDNHHLLLLVFNTETTTVEAQKISTLSFSSAPQVLGAFRAGENLAVTLLAGSRYLLLFEPQNLVSTWYQSNSGVILRNFVPLSQDLLLGLVGNTVNSQLATLGLDGSFCQGAYEQIEASFTDVALSLSIIDYDDLPHPTNSGNVSYTIKLYEFSAGNYEEGALEECETCSFSLESLCSEYSLRVTLSPETVSSCQVTDNFGEISCPEDCEAYYRANTRVTLSASCEEEGDFEFLGWAGACEGEGACSLTMDEDHEVTARFRCKEIEAPQSLTATPSSLAAGESFVLSWSAVAGAANYTVYRCGENFFDPETCRYETETTGTSVTLTAELPEEMEETSWYYFVVASRSCGSTAISDPVVVMVTAPLHRYALTVAVEPEVGGTIIAEGLSCPGDCSEDYLEDMEVTLVATPAEGYVFSGWAGDCAACEGKTCTLLMDSDKSCTAQFEEIVSEPQPDLVVTKLVTPRYWRYGRKARVTVMIENRGETDVTAPFVVRLYANPMANEVELGEVRVRGLRAGERKLVRFRFRIEDNLCFPDNYHVLHAIVDAEDAVAEANEENNEATKNIIIRGCPEAF